MNIKIRYKGTYLGLIWSALEPLFIFLLLYAVFTNIRIGRDETFAIYLISGVILLHLFTRGSMSGLESLRANRGILTNINIRKEFFPVVSTGTVAIFMLVEISVFLTLIPFFGFPFNWTLIFLPVIIGLLLCLILGASYLLSAVSLYVKDARLIWGVLSYSLIFISPVFWKLENAKGILLDFYKINPLGQLIEFNHLIVFGKIPTVNEWIYTSSIIFGILFFGYAIFQKFEKKVTEKI